MNEALLALSDGDRDRLREAVAIIEREIACLSHEGTALAHQAATRDLKASWAIMVALLAHRNRLYD